MKRIAFITALLCIVVLTQGAPATGKTMKIVYFDNYPPYSWRENGKMRGILVDIATEALQKRMGITVKHEGYPWERAQQMVKRGDADAFITVPTPERLEYTIASKEPVLIANFNPFVRAKSPIMIDIMKVKTLADLKQFSLGHYIGSGWARKNLAGMNVQWVANMDRCLQMLKAGRFDVFIDSSYVIRYNIRKLGFQKDIIEIHRTLDRATWNLCIYKGSVFASVMPGFDETLRNMARDGSLKKIYDKY